MKKAQREIQKTRYNDNNKGEERRTKFVLFILILIKSQQHK